MNFNLINLILHWVVSSLALLLTASIVPGFKLRGFSTALVATFLIGLANYIIWPLLFVLTIPLTILTLGLFMFVIDAIILKICAAFLRNFEIRGWLSAILGALILSVTSGFLHWILI